MAEQKYDIFISYRREGGYDTAKHLYDLLTRDGYRVSFDIDTLRSGNFDETLLNRIDQCKDFILIVDRHAFDRTLDSSLNPNDDWLRQELAYALKKDKNIIPIFLNGVVEFPTGLPKDISGVTKKNGPKYDRYYFNDFYRTLKSRFLKTKAKSKIQLHYIIFILSIFAIILLIYLYLSPLTSKQDTNILDYPEEVIDISEDSVLNSISEYNNPSDYINSFTGLFEKVVTQSIIWDMEINPKDKNINLIYSDILCAEDGEEDIENAIGYMMTFFHHPSVWEITNFNVSRDGKSALIDLILRHDEPLYPDSKPGLSHCKLKLILDDYNNLIVSFVSGTDIPWILGSIDSHSETTFTRVTR